jgi:hypothetical protein
MTLPPQPRVSIERHLALAARLDALSLELHAIVDAAAELMPARFRENIERCSLESIRARLDTDLFRHGRTHPEVYPSVYYRRK